MAKTDTAPKGGMHLAWYQSLETKLGLVFLLLLAMLTGGAYFANRVMVRDGLLDESQRYEDEVASRDAESINDAAYHASIFANALAELAGAANGVSPSLTQTAAGLVLRQPFAGLVTSYGVWPEPKSTTATAASGVLWLRDGKGGFVAHQEMNADANPYFRDRWYTPARFVGAGNCYWTGIREELISRAKVITCAMPITSAGSFAGVVTVSIALETLADRLNALQRDRNGYLLLLDTDQKLLTASSNSTAALGKLQQGQSLAELAKAHPDYAALAAGLGKSSDEASATVVKSARYQASSVSALRDATRGLQRQEAEDILVGIWGGMRQGSRGAMPLRIKLEHDPVLNESGNVSVYNSAESAWQVVRVAPANTSFAGVSYVFTQALVLTMALVTLTLLVVYYALRGLVIRPLRVFAKQLEGSTSVEDAINITLDESARNEVGVLAHWQNERVRQLAEALSATRSAKSQLSTESGERKQLQEQLARSQERATLALQSVADAVVVTDELGTVEDMNPAAETLTGITLRQARGKPLMEALKTSSADPALPPPDFARLVLERGTRLDYVDNLELTSSNGQHRQITLSAAPMRARGRIAGVVVVFRESSGRAVAVVNRSSEAPAIGNRDSITGLPTRATCEQRIEGILERLRLHGGSAALIYLDLDHLRRVNESGGQAAGDDVLVRTAETLAGIAPDSQDVYRLSADQFAVLVDNAQEKSGPALAEELRARLAGTRFYWESKHFFVTGSFGVCAITADCRNAMEVISRADDACSEAKRAGRNCVRLYEPSMHRADRQVDDGDWVRCIRRGIDENLFHLRTQWIMPSSENAAEGHAFEVLLALEDDEGFWASPGAFMPVAERHHLMPEVDRWVIRSTLNYLEAHPQVVGTLAFCCINLSALTIIDPSFLEFMVGELEPRAELAHKLCFEVRELSLTEHPHEALICCDALHQMGCKISVDQYFGRYMSDITMLRRLPVDHVKVDALSYKNLSSDPVEQMLAESTFRIARHLRRRVIVTGIEDIRAQETWRKLGANYFQGFAFAKPSPVVFLPPESQ